MTDLKSQCVAFAEATEGCGTCQGDAFNLKCLSTFGPVTVDFDTLLDPCNDIIQVKLVAEALGSDPVTVDYNYVPGSSLTTTNSLADEVTAGVTAQVDIATTVSNPKLNTLAASGTVDVCITLNRSTLPAEIGTSLDAITGLCAFTSGDLCRLAAGEKLCGKALSDLLVQNDLLKGIIENAIDFKIPDFELPITLVEQSVSYSCEDGVTRLLQGGGATTIASSALVQTITAAVTALAALFRL